MFSSIGLTPVTKWPYQTLLPENGNSISRGDEMPSIDAIALRRNALRAALLAFACVAMPGLGQTADQAPVDNAAAQTVPSNPVEADTQAQADEGPSEAIVVTGA